MKMLKKIATVFCVLFFCGLVFAFGGKAEDTKTSVTGYVKFYGNVPVAFAGFETVDGYVYTIQIADDSKITLSEIEEQQGYLLELTGEIAKDIKKMPNILKDGVFVVREWKKL